MGEMREWMGRSHLRFQRYVPDGDIPPALPATVRHMKRQRCYWCRSSMLSSRTILLRVITLKYTLPLRRYRCYGCYA